jgi:ammonium transporter Rh
MDYHSRNRKIFGFLLLFVEIAIIIFYGIFVRTEVHNADSNNTNYYPMFQDVNVMMLIGFGFLMTFIKHHSWSALTYTFFINAVVAQLYILWAPFWHKVFEGHWGDKIYLVEKTFTASSYSVASVLIAFGAVLGRVGPLELLIMALVQIIGYVLNEQIVYERIGVYDVGGSTAIHTFGAYFGLTVSVILSKFSKPAAKPESSYNSNIFALVGTLFLWMFWPSFNAGYFPTSPY